jgi:2-desacetyl-2-hydroxyethyl bacteriochlorophyllide A dehydrogenase
MRALVFTRTGVVEPGERALKAPAPDEAEVFVSLVGICGSDMLGMMGRSPGRVPPLVLGHEFQGRRVGDGRRVVANPLIGCGACARCRAGQANLCGSWRLLGLHVDGAMQERINVPRRNLVELPEDAPDLSMTLAEPLACAIHTVGLAPPAPGARCAIIGLGGLGTLIAVALRSRGVEQIDAFDRRPERLANAPRFGCRALAPEDAEPESYDFVADSAGYAATRAFSVRTARRGGHVMLVGYGEPEGGVDFVDVVRREIQLHGVMGYSPADFRAAVDMLLSGTLEEPGLYDIFPLERGAEAFAHAMSAGSPVRTLIRVDRG